MLARPYRLDVTRLAADYSAAIRAELTDNQLAKVQRGDAIADDYTDAAMLSQPAAMPRKAATYCRPRAPAGFITSATSARF